MVMHSFWPNKSFYHPLLPENTTQSMTFTTNAQ